MSRRSADLAFKRLATYVDPQSVDLWDWIGDLISWMFQLMPRVWLWGLLLTAILVVWWLKVPYFHV